MIHRVFLIFLLTSLFSCKCNFSGYSSFVKANEKKEFKNTSIDLNTIKYSLNIESCKKEKNIITIESSIHYIEQNELKLKNEKFYIIGCFKDSDKNDTLNISNDIKINFFIDKRKYDAFIFKEEKSTIGTKFLLKDF